MSCHASARHRQTYIHTQRSNTTSDMQYVHIGVLVKYLSVQYQNVTTNCCERVNAIKTPTPISKAPFPCYTIA
jgi:hypothetical protein